MTFHESSLTRQIIESTRPEDTCKYYVQGLECLVCCCGFTTGFIPRVSRDVYEAHQRVEFNTL